ncbi:MAG: ATP-binding protein [Microcoleus sp. PH2017_29_MFU_D_A]|uniref:AAA family ATPase n=1 Tax=Microcoleus sp. PH2017_37_MFU_D_B TaxID=2798847 RepID=UPI001DBCC3A9|nr:AAA family ATPase [Microcoleus sp. PH2017_37_MFU_D_B]MCC3418338.1 ATP-binding protein [Microcoleus sp. PH2017_07_MST_O_A]MCC3602355.1 ATP-binding protein [Microcoleus sp. PH2017_29_MFU_D_A]MCC3633421.1 ATP-binding protein [Microcoleus sp. PH2017_37_MFU_D_B]TAE52918.1 MAG: ATP-binding protein [Oscillatoriales cyanobacterium]
MTSPNVPRNAYTNAPEQHPNMILGSLQLLFWLFFHPSAWENHLKRINYSALWKLRIQAFLVLPVLANSIVLAFVLWLLEVPVQTIALGVAFGLAWGVGWGVGWGVASGLEWSLGWFVWLCQVSSVASSMVLGLRFGVALSVGFGVALGVALGVGSDVGFGVALGVGFGVGFGVALGVGFGVASSVALGVALGVVITIHLWLPVLMYPFVTLWNILLYQLDKLQTATKPSFLRWHSAFWDEWHWLPLLGLDKHILLIIERNPEEGKAALNYLSTSRQRWAAQEVQIELDARGLERCTDIAAIGNTYRNLALGELNSPASFFLSCFSHISKNVEAVLKQTSSYNQCSDIKPIAERLTDLLIRHLTPGTDKYTVRFRPIAISWYKIVTNYESELTQAIDSPYIIAVPLTEQQQTFTGRTDISRRIEQLLLDRRRPPLLLYGQRRMGKTSLLNNLGRLLPSNIIPMFVDLQGPVSSASDSAGFLYNIAKSMANSAKRQSALTLPSLDRETLQDDPFTRFDEWLDRVETALQENIALLALDEFEALDDAIRKGRFDEQDVLGMLRHLIQHRPRFKIMLAGSHTIEEFQRWASYLINVQVLHISYLKEPEARQLIEQPVQDFPLRYEPKAIDRVLQLTRCHPCLVQMFCAEIVALKNEQIPSIRRLATLADVEAAIPEALSVGRLFFADIQNNQVDAAGLAILQFLAAKGEGKIVSRETILQAFPDDFDAVGLLRQRELIEEVGDGYCFQVELMRRWFARGVR